MGVADKDWRVWRIFNDPIIDRISFPETQRKYIGEIDESMVVEPRQVMQGFGVFIFKKRKHRYEGEFVQDNFNGYGIYVW